MHAKLAVPVSLAHPTPPSNMDPRSVNMQQLARKIVQNLQVTPTSQVWLELEDEALDAAIRSILQVSGAQVVDSDADGLTAAVIETRTVDAALIPEALVDSLERVAPGARVLVVLGEADVSPSIEAYSTRQGRRLGLQRCSGVIQEERVILRGERRQRPRGAQLRELRGLGHSIDASVLVGRGGLTDEVMAAAEAALQRHGIVKVKLTPQCKLEKGEAARALAWGTGGDLVQRIGKTALLWRRDVPLDPPAKQRGRR